MTEAKKNPNGLARLTITLLVISAITALLLGLVNYVTADPIAAIQAEKTAAAMREVLPADDYQAVDYTGDNTVVSSVSQAITGSEPCGYVVEVAPVGFDGPITMMVGIDTNGAVTGISIVSSTETPGLGTKASDDSFKGQFVGGTGDFAVTKDGGQIDAITGATVTSRAVSNGVNAAVEAVQSLG